MYTCNKALGSQVPYHMIHIMHESVTFGCCIHNIVWMVILLNVIDVASQYMKVIIILHSVKKYCDKFY